MTRAREDLLFPTLDSPVNVASVPQRSPFRYAGGKSWLIPIVRRWLGSLSFRPDEFIEPFAGGASVGLAVGVENLADHVTLVELDPDVHSVWQCIFLGEAEQLADRILDFRLNSSSVREVLQSTPRNRLERAFRTIVRNRVLHGGILAPGASVMKEGENGKGLGSRWYPETLYRRIMNLAVHKRMFRPLRMDGLSIIKSNRHRDRVAIFVDPPYTVAGKRLYTYFDIDHGRLFRHCADSHGALLMTYDDTPEIRKLAAKSHLECRQVAMKSRQHTVKNELLISRDLSWLDLAPTR
ncbi:MAG: DNA adenine methylase [Phycisphaerales bacterium]|nr:DNA adenine methylase [Phycisphaerales bacterium]